MQRTLRIVFCGGGSTGHLAPAIAVYQAAKASDPDVAALFICARRADEVALLQRMQVPFAALRAMKRPQGAGLAWIFFPFRFTASVVMAWRVLKRQHPSALYATGGYVSLPVCLAAWTLRIPIVIHESDAVGGYANHVLGKIATVICHGFPIENPYPVSRVPRLVFTGNPVRAEMQSASRSAGIGITGFSGKRPVIMIIGGSQGSLALNDAVRKQLHALLELADVIHLTGRDKESAPPHARYWSRPYVLEEIPHLYALADVVVSRAGASVLAELASLKKAAIVVPLRGVARDHQQANARRLAEAGAVDLLPQEHLSELTAHVRSFINAPERRKELGEKLAHFFNPDAAEIIATIVLNATGLTGATTRAGDG